MVDPTSGFEGGVKFSHEMLASGRPFSAVLAFDDLTALGVMRGLAGAGLRVPEDCSVLGFDDVLPAEVATPAVTTIRQPLREMGLRAAEWTLEAIEEPEAVHKRAPRQHLALPELVARMSTAQASRRIGKG